MKRAGGRRLWKELNICAVVVDRDRHWQKHREDQSLADVQESRVINRIHGLSIEDYHKGTAVIYAS